MWNRTVRSTTASAARFAAAAAASAYCGYSFHVADAKPMYTREEVSKHKTAASRVWVTHEDKVYDITDFAKNHPGGDKILLAAGGSVDPYWTIYQQHNHEHVRKILAELQIGILDPKDVVVAPPVTAANDPYAKDPKRHPALIARSVKPFNAEPPAFLLTDSFVTPTEILFTRNHLPVPHVDATTYRLEIIREVDNTDGTRTQIPVTSLTLDELKTKFEHVSVVSALQCAGNRRGDMTKAKETRGLSWGVAAMGNVEWRGVRLRDVLKAAGIREEDIGTAVRHLQFEGLDKDPMSSTVYAASIPADRGWSPTADVVLAFEMNGKPLTKDHGYPVRAVVPGVTGARQVKWLGRIIASPHEADSLWQAKDYKAFPASMDMSNVQFDSMPAIQDMPVTSAICEPSEGSALVADKDGEIKLKGFAWSGGGKAIARVDVSADGGETWHVADLTHQPEDPTPSKTRSWGWSLWSAIVPIPAVKATTGEVPVQLTCKAVDIDYNTQPENAFTVWNFRGLVNNSFHRVNITVKREVS